MASNASRTAWALLLLRVIVGLAAIHHGLKPLFHARGVISLGNAQHLLISGLEFLSGCLFLLGVWMPAACAILWLAVGGPLVHGWLHKASVLGDTSVLFRLLATLASALGGAGRWGVGKG
jgi:hypothetical protein